MGFVYYHSPIVDDGGPNVEIYNSLLTELRIQKKDTWFSAPWLFAEYVTVHSASHSLPNTTVDVTCEKHAP